VNRDITIDNPGDRCERIAALYRARARELERRVARRAHADPQTIEDACSYAWLQLLTHPAVDVGAPSHLLLGWLTKTATREVRDMGRRARDVPLDPGAIKARCDLRGPVGPGADELAAHRARLDLVDEIPERPRRFLLRLALGYSYRAIAIDERASLTTTNKQIACAKRRLRALDADGVAHQTEADREPQLAA
jgi:DNA-directed RNA polymerase specialized sigma24 family protein